MPNENNGFGEEYPRPDIFSRLSIAMCPQDDGTRPVNPAWVGCHIGWLSPAIKFSLFPIPPGQMTQVNIHINNFGTADSSGVSLQTAYNIYIGNQAQTMINVKNATLPIIPAGGSYAATVNWTPQNVTIAHACFHARVMDTYSLLHYAARCFNWDSYINPQAGNHNTLIIKIPDKSKALVVKFPVKNSFSNEIRPKLLVTDIDNRSRFSDIEERFPLPFVPDHLTSTSVHRVDASSIEEPDSPFELEGFSPMVTPSILSPHFAREIVAIPTLSESMLWPRHEIHPRFIHDRYGFDVHDTLDLPPGTPQIERGYFFPDIPTEGVEINSYYEMKLAGGEEGLIKLIIPPEEFPPEGRRRKFQVDYQVGSDRPVQHILYVYQ